MYELLLDSSNKYLAVGLAKNGTVIDKIFYEAWQRQSEVMATEIDNILVRNNLTKENLDAVVVGIGPGSYTGVRIAITIAKTIAYCLKIKIYCVSSLFTLQDSKNPTICLYNARSGRSYFAVYENNKELEANKVLTNEEVKNYIDEHKNYSVNGDTTQVGLESGNYDVIGNLAAALKDEFLVDSPFAVKPLYLKDL